MDRELTLEEGLFALCEEPPFGTIKNEEEML